MQSEKLIKSPLNYTGGKFRLLPQILPLFPKKIDNFYDIFCGGANVAVNITAERIFCQDINEPIISLYNYFLKNNEKDILKIIESVIAEYELSNTSKHGYEYYECNSSDGVGKFNQSGYAALKKGYNNYDYKYDKNILFYILIVFGFNNQIRFNGKKEFNIPVGKRDFNEKMRANLIDFIRKIKQLSIIFEVKTFKENEFNNQKDNFVYADPPYLITTATYNESNGWGVQKEKELLNYLSELNNENIKFALSNVIRHKNKENEILIKWIEDNKFKLHLLSHSYSNASYQAKDKKSITQEVLVTNY